MPVPVNQGVVLSVRAVSLSVSLLLFTVVLLYTGCLSLYTKITCVLRQASQYVSGKIVGWWWNTEVC